MAHGRNLRQRLNKARLEKLYRRERLTFSQIGARYGARPPAVRELMDEYSIRRRPRVVVPPQREPRARKTLMTGGSAPACKQE